MSDEFARWNELARLWHAQRSSISADDVEQHARREHRRMLQLAMAEGAGLVVAFVAANWIAMQTAFVAMSAISMVFFGVCFFVHHRMRREPPPSGGADLLSSLRIGAAREAWNLAQLAIGRAVTAFTLIAMGLLAIDHLRHATTPPARLWSLLGVALIVVGVLAWNLVLTRAGRRRKARIEAFVKRLGDA
jgi:FtsH-binding integral membrane protein